MMRIVFDTNGNTQHFPAMWGRTRVITTRQLVELVTPRP